MTERCIAGTLTVTQRVRLNKIALNREYDMAFASVSWEQRSTSAFAATTPLPKTATLMRFASGDAVIDRRKDATQEALSRLFTTVGILKLEPSIHFRANAALIETHFRDEFLRLGRPLKILLDITCMPKSYLLFLIGMGFTHDYVCRLDCVYAEGAYNLQASTTDPMSGEIGLISEGEWDALQIPYLGAESVIPTRRDLIVSMGGEIGLSIPFIERYEPRRLGLVLIAESLAQTPDKLPPTEAAALMHILTEGNIERLDVHLADVVGLIGDTLRFCRNTSSETVSGIVLGSKPHALALGVAALTSDNLELICRVPKRYRPLDVPPAGPLAFYEVEDRFEPSTYLS